MRITRFRDDQGTPRAGEDQGDGTARPFATADVVADRTPTGAPIPITRRLAPVLPTNIFCIGLNYRRHAAEMGSALPEHPVVFMKPTTALNHPGAPIQVPACCLHGPEVDFEGEMAVVIGRAGRDIPEERALEHVLGYTVANDVSARRWQKRGGGGQWVRGKSFDTFCPLGPVLVTADELTDPQSLALRTEVDGVVMQESHTSDMIFTVAQIIAFLSRDTTLQPGTVILTGTPEGVGMARTPPVWLEPGARVRVTIDGIGTLDNPVEDAAVVRA
jgi:2-keto-4-pentenoate hydratase/2-oxohepta-3-ene-1,7-dioic acid hydratase in catechol pathway